MYYPSFDLLATLMNGTLIGMKSMDEGKHDLISLVCRVRTSYKPPTLQPGNITEKVAWLYLWQIVNEFVIQFIDCDETWTRDFSTTNHGTPMGHLCCKIAYYIKLNCLKNHDFKKVFDHDSTVDLLKTFYLKVSRNHHTLI